MRSTGVRVRAGRALVGVAGLTVRVRRSGVLGSHRGARIGRAHRNDLENLVLFAIAGGLYVATGGPRLAGFAYCGLFLLARLLHTFAHLVGRPMSRRNAYTLGFLVIVVISLHTAVVLIGLA